MVLCSYLNCLSFFKTWIFLRSKKVFPSCFVCFALLISQLTKLFLPFDWKDLISRLLSKSRFVFVLSICFFILNLCFIRFSMSTNSHLSLERCLHGNRTSLCVPQSNKNFVLAHGFSSYAYSLFFQTRHCVPPLKKWWR